MARFIRLSGTLLLAVCGAVLVSATRVTLKAADLATALLMASFVCALGMLSCSIAAFWWPLPSFRRLEWAGYLLLALMLAEQFAVGPGGNPIHSVALVFGMVAVSIVMSRFLRSRGTQTAACNCG